MGVLVGSGGNTVGVGAGSLLVEALVATFGAEFDPAA